MSRFANLFLIAAAALLVLIGVAAQTGTISLPRGESGTVRVHQTAHQQPQAPHPAQPTPPPPGGGGDGDD